MKVRDIMTKQAEVISPDSATIEDAAIKMQSLDCGFLPVCDNDQLVGSITDRDIVVRGLANGSDPSSTTVRDAMTPKALYASEDDDVSDAANRMRENQIRRLPVLDSEKRLVGIVSLGDLALRFDDGALNARVLQDVSRPS